jgi:crossover junction endodeoxyribonuclease RuvC
MTRTAHRGNSIIGIDPGLTGGIAVVTRDGSFVYGDRMPVMLMGKRKMVDTFKLTEFLDDYCLVPGSGFLCPIVIEANNSMPRQGLQSTFNFGRHSGAVEGWAIGTGQPLKLVTASQWKKYFGLSSDKRASMDRAALEFGRQPLWDVLANNGIAEAALIALWWARTSNQHGDSGI